jgi:protein involved in polysaccharide export with SLBB domain
MKIALLFFLLVLCGLGCVPDALAQEPSSSPTPIASNSPEPAETKSQTPAGNIYLIGTGDTLEIVIARRPELGWRGQVGNDGTIPALPYLEKPITALCRTTDELSVDVKEAYSRLVKDPSVTVRVVERSARPVIVFGAIRTSQRFQLRRDVQLNELLFLSGGVTDRASGDIQIFRTEPFVCTERNADSEQPAGTGNNPLRVIKILDLMAGKPDTNPIIRSGDIVTVMVAEPVYVAGGVVSPQSVNFRDQLTLGRAIAMVGGLADGAHGDDIRIYRRRQDAAETTVIRADYNAIRKQQKPDIPLAAYDIVEVPSASASVVKRNWQLAAQEIVLDEKRTATLPIRVVN